MRSRRLIVTSFELKCPVGSFRSEMCRKFQKKKEEKEEGNQRTASTSCLDQRYMQKYIFEPVSKTKVLLFLLDLT